MKYISTRGGCDGVSSAYAIKKGLCADGGLYMPEAIPQLTAQELKELCGKDYAGRAEAILNKYLDDFGPELIHSLCQKAYSPERFGNNPVPVIPVGDRLSVMELWHGPTCAFKDMALQMTPLLLSNALAITGEKRTACVLVATSGDTGKAALEGYRDVPQTKIIVFYPKNGVSCMQKLQMDTQEGNNVAVYSINGNFDDAQSAVKSIFSDAELNKAIENTAFLSSANSINWGRLVPQIAYYVSSYCDLVSSGKISMGENVNFAVPTGNFGNIFAGYLAKRMGLPIRCLICASNTNNILSDFLKTGIYNRERRFYQTMSPSMDILISSNLERLLYLLAGCEETKNYMTLLSTQKKYSVLSCVKAKLDKTFFGGWCDESMTAQTIKTTFSEYKYLCDPHTAVAMKTAREYMRQSGDSSYMVVASTASAYKFPASVYSSLTNKSVSDEFEAVKLLSEFTDTEIPKPIASLISKSIRFNETLSKESMSAAVLNLLG
ncbi:MAG: threonine synthase [Oscillospiraceae bacterium]|nr:threonine synthase [Oscillospiraceae bacterium]